MNDYGQIHLAAAATERACDPITLEIVRGALRATQSEMEALIERTAMSNRQELLRGLSEHRSPLSIA